METYFPMPNNERDSATMLYARDRLDDSHSESPVFQENTIMFSSNYTPPTSSSVPNYDSNTSQQEILLNYGGSQNNRNEMLMMNQGTGLLSLSLNSNVSPIQYQDFSSIISHNNNNNNINNSNNDNNNNNDNNVSAYNGMPSVVRAVPNSKYLRAAQQLLDEVVSVKKSMKDQNAKREFPKNSKQVEEESCEEYPSSSPTVKASRSEISVAEKQDLQNKMSKLLSMLDEVDRRYRQYYHQMQIVVSSFDVIAGAGAAKPYTAVALETISRHFRCLRDSINNQIHLARKSLGEEDSSSNDNKGVGISRLRFVDHQLRQHRALQQLGIMQQHAWRPQRGLPETSVSILRAWLFEHFLHPYPKDSDKIMLARQTGLTRSQVSNWFINARVRLWKPMVEEMYKEETGDAEIDSNSSSETISRTAVKLKPSNKNRGEDFLLQGATISTDQITDIEMMGSDSNSIFQTEPPQMDYGIGKRQTTESTRYQDSVVESSCGSERFITSAYHISDMERFGSVSEVSLTLGLQQCEGGFIPLRESDAYNASASAMGTENAEFDRRNQFISSLLPSFT
ncbi:hypothetical protein ABFS82_02G020200 [Erythranthe guttata]|uniref:Homeobox domain-containing protein n=1 Tax=Erythranthe guttata TaxID=4155 RepID=A0A022RCP1_ERYGU|nr:PREDICTED: BEL1-like homeodomain protein 7 [Erythranthe guttata]EYU37829.1 hypothetical protein MIMGU_mgv1a003764mg [Erythranthe guttata]|eukprot:XP_012837077.1 PREDICTED: BEL1-like homeodomain protein 7 [Erythranthe guttata]